MTEGNEGTPRWTETFEYEGITVECIYEPDDEALEAALRALWGFAREEQERSKFAQTSPSQPSTEHSDPAPSDETLHFLEDKATDSKHLLSDGRRKYFSVTEIKDYLGLSRSMVYGLIDRGELPASKFGGSLRVSRQDILDYEERGRLRRP